MSVQQLLFNKEVYLVVNGYYVFLGNFPIRQIVTHCIHKVGDDEKLFMCMCAWLCFEAGRQWILL